jgi:hypothetical protein
MGEAQRFALDETELIFPRQPWGTLIRLGYSGSLDGMAKPQLLAIHQYLVQVFIAGDNVRVEAHHGDCDGGDKEFHVIATVLGCRTIAHPPVNPAKRAWCKADEVRAPKDYLSRGRDIASETWELLAAPQSPEPDPHSRTWITAGYAAQMGHPVWIFLPDGSVREFGLAG